MELEVPSVSVVNTSIGFLSSISFLGDFMDTSGVLAVNERAVELLAVVAFSSGLSLGSITGSSRLDRSVLVVRD